MIKGFAMQPVQASRGGGKSLCDTFWSTCDSAVLECNYESIVRCWEQKEQGLPGRTAHTRRATGYFTYRQPRAAQRSHHLSGSMLW